MEDAILKDDVKETLEADVVNVIKSLPQKKRQDLLRRLYGSQFPLNKTYYNQKYALAMLEDIKHMIATGDVLLYPYINYPKWSPTTVYLYVTNGFKYAVDNMDDEKHSLKALRDKVYITKDNDAVRVHYRADAILHVLKAIRVPKDDPRAISDRLKKPDVIPEEETSKWRSELFDWMEKAKTGEQYPKEGKEFKVMDEDLDFLNGMFDSDDSFGLSVNTAKMTFFVRKIV